MNFVDLLDFLNEVKKDEWITDRNPESPGIYLIRNFMATRSYLCYFDGQNWSIPNCESWDDCINPHWKIVNLGKD